MYTTSIERTRHGHKHRCNLTIRLYRCLLIYRSKGIDIDNVQYRRTIVEQKKSILTMLSVATLTYRLYLIPLIDRLKDINSGNV